MSPENRVAAEIAKMDEAETIYDRLLHVTEQWQQSEGQEEREIHMWEIDKHLDTALEKDLAGILGWLATERG